MPFSLPRDPATCFLSCCTWFFRRQGNTGGYSWQSQLFRDGTRTGTACCPLSAAGRSDAAEHSQQRPPAPRGACRPCLMLAELMLVKYEVRLTFPLRCAERREWVFQPLKAKSWSCTAQLFEVAYRNPENLMGRGSDGEREGLSQENPGCGERERQAYVAESRQFGVLHLRQEVTRRMCGWPGRPVGSVVWTRNSMLDPGLLSHLCWHWASHPVFQFQ